MRSKEERRGKTKKFPWNLHEVENGKKRREIHNWDGLREKQDLTPKFESNGPKRASCQHFKKLIRSGGF